MFRVISLNANGIRSAKTKGFFEWFLTQDADVLCIQELKAQDADISEAIREIGGYKSYFHCAEKKGYSGCGLWCRQEPKEVRYGFGSKEFDPEGRYMEADFGNIKVISTYFPSGSSSEVRQEAKYRFLDEMIKHMDELFTCGKEVIMCGDMNIAHKEIDLKNWKGNQKNSGFLPEERQWMTDTLEQHGWVDVFRRLDKRPERYTWWSQRGQARAKNVGWRIDYHLTTPGIAGKAVATDIYVGEKFSDHAPVIVDYNVNIED